MSCSTPLTGTVEAEHVEVKTTKGCPLPIEIREGSYPSTARHTLDSDITHIAVNNTFFCSTRRIVYCRLFIVKNI